MCDIVAVGVDPTCQNNALCSNGSPRVLESSGSTGASDIGQPPRLLLLKVVCLVRCLCPYGRLSRSPTRRSMRAAFALPVLAVASRASIASHHMENVVKFVFQSCPHYWEPHAACAQTLISPG